MPNLEKLENFMRLLHKVENVKRVARVPDETEFRNTAEHTFELALMCWYVASVNNLSLNTEKILKYALAHDLIEAYAGDTPVFDQEGQKTKATREAMALEQLESEFSDFGELIETIHEYEKKEDEESRFVYAADKLIDPLNASMEKTQSIWADMKVTYQEVRDYKDTKVVKHPLINDYWKKLTKKLEENYTFFFPESKS